MCVCVGCACPTGDWPPCDRPVLTEPARVPLLARCRTGAAAAGHLHSHALLPLGMPLCCPGAWTCRGGGEQVGARVALQNGLAESLETRAEPSCFPWRPVIESPRAIADLLPCAGRRAGAGANTSICHGRAGPPTSRNRSREVKFARAIDTDCALRYDNPANRGAPCSEALPRGFLGTS